MMFAGLRSRWTTPRCVRELDREADLGERAQQALPGIGLERLEHPSA
jgi:hypothetical protein